MTSYTRMVVIIYSHHFEVILKGITCVPLMKDFCEKLTEYAYVKRHRRWVYAPIKTYASITKDKLNYRFHIHALDKFKLFLDRRGVDPSYVEYANYPTPEPYHTEFKIDTNKYQPRENQPKIFEYLSKPHEPEFPRHSKLVELQTGKGKTYLACYYMSMINVVTGIFLQPMYFAKWREDLTKKYFDLKDNEICNLSGSKAVRAVIMAAKQRRLPYKVYFFSTRTFSDFLSDYEENPEIAERQWGCAPHQVFEILGIGFKLCDEFHKEFHFGFRWECFTSVKYSVCLTATLLTKNQFVTRMYNLIFPANTRMEKIEWHRYTAAEQLHVNFKKPDLINTTEYGSPMFSMNAVEFSIMRHIPTLLNYFRMIQKELERNYIDVELPGKKALIFSYRTDMCAKITDYLKSKYPNLKIKRYCEDDSEDGLHDADVIVSTLQSAGTALDFNMLAWVFMLVQIDSPQQNVQALGRLRHIPGFLTRFTYAVFCQFAKPMEYAHAKSILFSDKVLSHEARKYLGDL